MLQSRVQGIRRKDLDPKIKDLRKLVRRVAIQKNDPVYGAIIYAVVKDGATRDTQNTLGTVRAREASQNNMSFSIQTVNSKSTGSDTKIRCHVFDREHNLENC